MSTESEVAKELDALVGQFPELLTLCQEKRVLEFGAKYQEWYSRATKIVELLGPDRLHEFRSYYRIDPKRRDGGASTYVIQDYVTNAGEHDYFHGVKQTATEVVRTRLYNQLHILSSLKSRLASVLADVRGHLLAEIEDEELAVAAKLVKVSLRGAGAVAGVVLEGHLQRVAANHGVKIAKKDPTISDLNARLKEAGVYELATSRKIQLMADLRNLCDHKKQHEPTEPEVVELISGVASIVKTIY